MKKTWLELLISLGAGILIGAGFTLGGMTDPGNVVGFLDFHPGWRPQLLGVLGGAVIISLIGFQTAKKMKKPWFSDGFPDLSNKRIDRQLVLGSALFGLGWGLVGYCPGPAIATAGLGSSEAILFTFGMLAGGLSFQFWPTRDCKH